MNVPGKRVSFGNQLSPEIFDKTLPPITPVRRGTTPRNTIPQATRPLLKRQSFVSATAAHATIFEEEQPGSPALQAGNSTRKMPRKTSPKVSPKLSPKQSPKVTPAKRLAKVAPRKSPAKVTPKRSPKVTPVKVTPVGKASPKLTAKKTTPVQISPVRQPSHRKSTSPFKHYPDTPSSKVASRPRKSSLNLSGLAELMTSPPSPAYRRVDTPRPPKQKRRTASMTPAKPTPGKAAALKAIYGKAALKMTMKPTPKKTPQRRRVATPADRKSTKKLWSDIVRAGVAVKGVGPVKGTAVKQRKVVIKKKMAQKVQVSAVS